MNTNHFIQVGWYLKWQTQIYQITGIDVVHQIMQAELLHTRETVALPMATLFSGSDEEQAAFAPTLEQLNTFVQQAPRTVDAAELPEALLTRANHIISTVETVEAMASQLQQSKAYSGRTVALQQAVKQLHPPISLATFYKYRRLYEAHQGSRTHLASALHRSTFQQSRFSRAEFHFIDTLILRYYARSRPLRPLTVYQLGQAILARTRGQWLDPEKSSAENVVEELLDVRLPIEQILNNPEKSQLLTEITLPSRGWFYNYLKWFISQPDQGKQVIQKRHGSGMWEQTYAVFDSFISRASAPLQYVFADHYLLDVFTVDEASRSQVDRLWLTALIDAYSRSILGIALLDEYPSIMSIQSALQHAIWPKTSHQAWDIEADWICYGIPQQLSLDNAWAHHSYSLEDVARAVSRQGHYASIDLVFRPPYRARYGALIERYFGQLSSQLKAHLPGAIQSSHPKDRGQAAAQACLLYQDIDRILHQLIVRYQHTPHSELGDMTPHEKWVDGLGMSSPLVPPRTLEMERLFWRLNHDTRVMTSKGISAFGMHYWSPQWGGTHRIGRDGQRIRYHFRYDPRDISRIALFHEGQWLGDGQAKELRQADGRVRSLSLAERRLAQQRVREMGNTLVNWLHFVNDIDDLTRQRQREKHQARRALQRNTRPPLAITPVEPEQDYTNLLAEFVNSSRGEQS